MRSFFSLLAVSVILSSYAQSTSMTFTDAIGHYEEKLGITFSFEADLIKLADSRSLELNSLTEFIEEVQSQFPLEILKIDESYYTISAFETSYRLEVYDSLEGSPLNEVYEVQVIVNDAPIATVFEAGIWTFKYKPYPNDIIKIFSLGFEPYELSSKDLFNQKNLKVSLGLPTTRLNTVVVEDYLTKGINLMPSSQSIQIDVNDLPLLPGETDGDIFASLSALPGISNPDGRAGNLMIRGSESDQTLILYDNIPIYHRGHYYGTISPYNPKIVKDVAVYRSGFHPRVGDRVGGAIVINSDVAVAQSNYGVGANSLFGMGYGKFRLSDKWSGSLSFRNSYPRRFQSPKLEQISESVFAGTSLVDPRGTLTQKVEVTFRDYNGRVDFQYDDRNRFSISGIFTSSEVNFMPVTPPDAAPRSNDNNYVNAGANLSWLSELGSGWSSELNTTYSEYDFEFTINTLAPGAPPFLSDNNIKDFNVVHQVSKQDDRSTLDFGLDYKWQEVSRFYQNELGDSSLFMDQKNVGSSTIAPFVNYEYIGLDKWYFQVGFRGTYYSLLDDLSIAPRVLINYDLSDHFILKASHGWYNQFISQVKNLEYSSGGFDNELWTLADNETGFIIRGMQSMTGATISANRWIIDAEIFYKTANNITIYEDKRLEPGNTFYTMDQITYGVDLLTKRQVNEMTDLWIGYSYHGSEIVIDTAREISYKSKFVQPHVFYIGGAWKKNRWKVSASWRYASGLSTETLEIAYVEATTEPNDGEMPPQPPQGGPPPQGGGQTTSVEDLPDRYPAVHSLDISASYKIPKTDERKWSASIGLSIINTLDQTNLTDQVFRNRDGFIDREAIGFAPNLMIIIER